MTFFKGTRVALITAFATSSSSATMPLSLKCAQENLGVRPQTAGFVIPLGTQLNMDGTALYEAAAALFIANLMGLRFDLESAVGGVSDGDDCLFRCSRDSECGHGHHDYGIAVCRASC